MAVSEHLEYQPKAADARIYGKVVSWPEPGRFVVRLTAVPSVAAVQLAERRASR